MSRRPPRQRSWMVACALLLGFAGSMPLPVCADNNGVRSASHVDTTSGEQTYRRICQGCHMPDGRGAIGAGHYPAFAGNPTMASASYMAVTILQGRRDMPSFKPTAHSGGFFRSAALDDAQVASVVNYIRTHFGNHYTDRLTSDEVATLREQLH